MSTYIMTISNTSKKKISDSEIERHKSNYLTGQDGFMIVYTDENLPNGFVITKDDNLMKYVIDKKKVTLDKDLKATILKEKKIIKDGAMHSKDTSILKGEKPYEPK